MHEYVRLFTGWWHFVSFTQIKVPPSKSERELQEQEEEDLQLAMALSISQDDTSKEVRPDILSEAAIQQILVRSMIIHYYCTLLCKIIYLWQKLIMTGKSSIQTLHLAASSNNQQYLGEKGLNDWLLSMHRSERVDGHTTLLQVVLHLHRSAQKVPTPKQ